MGRDLLQMWSVRPFIVMPLPTFALRRGPITPTDSDDDEPGSETKILVF